MREIEFRGKRTCDNEWVYGRFIGIYQTEDGDVGCIRDYTGKDNLVKLETIGQYTGLKDKNGKKIFEGDIVEINTDDNSGNINGFKGVVVYENTSFMLNEIGYDCFETLDYWESELEVVGNIYDNKELLEEQDA